MRRPVFQRDEHKAKTVQDNYCRLLDGIDNLAEDSRSAASERKNLLVFRLSRVRFAN